MVISIFNCYVDNETFAPMDTQPNGVKVNGQDKAVEVPALVIGGGPSGLLQAYLLLQLGVKTLVIERYPERLGAPMAYALSPRSL